MNATATATNYVIDVTEQTFNTEVIERSKSVPVVVDFWAEWCGPCRMLGPTLEKLANEYNGQFILAKVDVDQNPQISAQYYVQGIPAVKAFKEGKVADEFTGALPELQVRDFIDKLAPSEAELLTKQAFDWEVNGKPAIAETNYREALAKKADYYTAKVGLGRVLLNQGEVEQATEILNTIPQGIKERTVADALLAGAQFLKHATGYTEAELQANIQADTKDMTSRYSLACLYASQQQFPQALEAFLQVIYRDRKYEDDGARKAMLAIFTILGEDNEVTKSYRRKLANALF